MLRRRNWIALAGLAVLVTAAARAEDFAYTWGQPRTYRWNEQRTGFGFDPTDPAFKGLPSNQLPSISVELTDTKGNKYLRMTPDLTWIYPLDVEGGNLDEKGNQYPLGYTLGEIHSSPTVSAIETLNDYTLTVMFGSSTKVARHLRNTLPPKTDPTGLNSDPSDGRAGEYTTNGVYDSAADPFSYLEGQTTGAVFSVDALSGTTERLDDANSYGDLTRAYQPFWWWGVRNLPWYTASDTETTSSSTSSTAGFESSPSLDQHRLMIAASDSLVRAFDWGPWEARSPKVAGAGQLPYGAEDTVKERPRREALASRYLSASTKSTTNPKSGPGVDTGAGRVTVGRPDIPERLTDRLYNLSVNGPIFGLYANRDNIGSSSPDTLGTPIDGKLDNHFRLANGMGAVNSTGVLVRLSQPITYTNRYYPYVAAIPANAATIRRDHRDPAKITEDKGLQTDQLYIVGSDDGYVYAFDARADNARRVPASGGTPKQSTWVGRLVWAFRAAVRAPLYHSAGKNPIPLTVDVTAPGEFSGSARMDSGGDYITLKGDQALVAPDANIITGPIVSSPVAVDVALDGSAFSHPGTTRTVILFGSSIGRLFCLDAATGMEEWEFKTTPVGQTRVHVGSNIVNVDAVAGQPILTSPTLGYLPNATSQLRPTAPAGRVAVFFGADDGKVYALDVADGTPIRDGSTNPGWDVANTQKGGTAGQPDRYMIDHFGFVVYPFERGTTDLPASDYEGKYGRVIPSQWGARRLLGSVVARPSVPNAYQQPLHPGWTIPAVDAIFVVSPTNQADASITNEPGFSGGTIWRLDAKDASVDWAFYRFKDVRRKVNADFDKDPGKDYLVRPGGFSVTPAYASGIQMYDESKDPQAAGTHDGEIHPLTNQNVLFAVDSTGRMFAIQADGTAASEDRMYWRLPFSLPAGGVGTGTNMYSTPVVTSPDSATNNQNDIGLSLDGRSWVYVGTSEGLVAIDTTAMRRSPITDNDGNVLPAALRYTGGEMTWGWQTPRESFTLDTENTDANGNPTTTVASTPMPVVSTPAVHAGMVFAGSDNGLMYAWGHQPDLLNGFGFDNTGGGGRGRYTGGRRFRQRLPEGNRPPGGAITTATKEFFVEVFQAGFDYGFTNPTGVTSVNPSGAPEGSDAYKTSSVAITPTPMGKNADFQTTAGGLLEWGDPIVVAAWGPALDAVTSLAEEARGTFTFQLTGPSTSGSLKAPIEVSGSQGVARQIFYLNPFTRRTPNALLYPKARREVINPLAGQLLPPGQRPPYFTVTGYYQPPDAAVAGPNGDVTNVRQPQQRVKINPITRFHLANPINMTGYFKDGMPGTIVPAGSGKAIAAAPDGDRNGNLVRVPIVPAVVGDHGVNTIPQAQALTQIIDRSHLPLLRALANQGATGLSRPGDNIALRVRVQPARLRWVGGPAAAYKPMFYAQRQDLYPNSWPLQIPPEPMALDTNNWVSRVAGFYPTTDTQGFIGAEQPPYLDGEENKSQDYPDMDTRTSAWIQRPQNANDSEENATANDVAITGQTGSTNAAATFYLRASVPKYQPANYSPTNINTLRPGFGPGYYTVNPANSTAVQAAIMGWNRNATNKGGYIADIQDPSLQYMGPMRTTLPASNTFIAQEPQYLTKVYADVNGNGSADVDAGEAYRMFVSGVEVRPSEAMRVTTPTIDIPRGAESAVPGGYIPFQFYYDRQAEAVGATGPATDPYLYGERNFYSPFALYNTGNVNLWDVRVDKYDPYAGHLSAPSVNENPLFGAEPFSNWPATGILRRTNIASTLDALPVAANATGGAGDPVAFTPVLKPHPGGQGDEGEGRIIAVKDVFAFVGGPARPHPTAPWGKTILNTKSGLPYLTVAVPPGTAPGRYSTQQNQFVVFEDSGGPIYGNGRAYNGVLDMGTNGPAESGVTSNAVISVNVAETRLTDKVSQMPPFLPIADKGVAFASQFNGQVNGVSDIEKVWATLAQDTTPSAYRDPITGDMVTFWSSNRTQVGKDPISGLTVPDSPTDTYHIFATAMKWTDPQNPPVKTSADVSQFITGTLATNPWGWQYFGGNRGNFFFPEFDKARWFGEPTADPWLPNADTINVALGAPSGTYGPLDLNYTSPAVITSFHGTKFPPVVFWTGVVGVGPESRSAIFYAPVQVDRATGEVTTSKANIQAVGVINGIRSLDPFTPKFGPRPFLITAGGDLTASGNLAPTARLVGEKVIGLGVVWFGGAPGAWKLYVSTIPTDDSGTIRNTDKWNTTQLALPAGITSALSPSVYYHQWPVVLDAGGGEKYRQATVEVAFTGYSGSSRNPDIYVARYIAMKSAADGSAPAISNFASMGFARKGGDPGNRDDKPLEPLVRVAGDPRPVYSSHWINWLGRRNLGTVIYWFQKPVGSTSTRDYKLFATFTTRNPGGNNGNVVEVRPSGGNPAGVTAFVNAAAGTVRFTTTNPVDEPAPLTRPHLYNGVMVQDYIYVAMNPYALRVTVDEDVADSQPQIWLDESHEVYGPDRQDETNFPISANSPLEFRRDRLWVLWRRGGAPEGATRQTSLFYTTYRLGVDLGQDLGAAEGSPADVRIPLNNNGRPDIEIRDANGNVLDYVFTVDRDKGRVYFTEAHDGDQVEIRVAGKTRGLFTVGWVPENLRAPTVYGTQSGSTFRLPVIQPTEPLAVPTQGQGNDAMPWLFKDPWSDIPVNDPAYYARSNNNMWLYWSSTRPSRAYGNARSAPTIPPDPNTKVDPFYWDTATGSLMYAGSASDVYFATLNPDFVN